MSKKTTLLCILDGWGIREEEKYNAIKGADIRQWSEILREYPHSALSASGPDVGLPEGQMGNSEVGHMNIGSGRIIDQLLPRITKSIQNNKFPENKNFVKFVADVKKGSGVCHLLGILSDGGVHGHEDHLIYIAKSLASNGIKVKIHAFLDGRDTPPKSAVGNILKLNEAIETDSNIEISSVAGRYFAMDRDNNWERTSLSYEALVNGVAEAEVSDFVELIEKSYENGVTDEFIKPHILKGFKGIIDGDGVLITNYRADRIRQLSEYLFDEGFSKTERSKKINFSGQISMAEYSKEISKYLPCLFPSEIPKNTLGQVISDQGLKQLHIAETEKYAHVTFFFNGGVEKELEGEKRILVDSPAVSTYDLQPEMSAPIVCEELLGAIDSEEFDFIVVNFANPDMVGHTGVWEAAISAVNEIDRILGELKSKILEKGGNMIVTADHGNIELMYNEEKEQSHTAHTLNLVPFVLISKEKNQKLHDGRLCDIAPTILELMGLDKPSEMTGKSLIEKA